MQSNDVFKACQAIVSSGKKPTIALVKTKLLVKVPLTTIVQGIQQFNNSSAASKLVATKDQQGNQLSHEKAAIANENSYDKRLIMLETQVETMTAYIKALQEQVKALEKR